MPAGNILCREQPYLIVPQERALPLISKGHLGQRAYACDRDLVEVMTSSPSLFMRFFSCAGQHLQLTCAVWEVLGDANSCISMASAQACPERLSSSASSCQVLCRLLCRLAPPCSWLTAGTKVLTTCC